MHTQAPTQINSAQLSTDVLNAALTNLKEQLTTILEEKFKEHTDCLHSIINKQKNEIDFLKQSVISQAVQIEKLENTNRRKYAIINGLPEVDDNEGRSVSLSETINKLIDDIGLADTVKLDPKFQIFRIGKKETSKSRPVKIKLQSESMKHNLVTLSREHFKNNENKVYINYDQGPLTRKENFRLRISCNKLRNDPLNKNKRILLQKGKITVNGVIVDSFNLENAILKQDF